MSLPVAFATLSVIKVFPSTDSDSLLPERVAAMLPVRVAMAGVGKVTGQEMVDVFASSNVAVEDAPAHF